MNRLFHKTLLVCIHLAALCVSPGTVVAEAGAPKVAAGRESCHGAGGNSKNANVPRLNGQHGNDRDVLYRHINLQQAKTNHCRR
jgi:cytochrome c553